VQLKEISRIQHSYFVTFFVLPVLSLLERELPRAQEQGGIESVPLNSEGCPCPGVRPCIDRSTCLTT
jgi:hypothetical protein